MTHNLQLASPVGIAEIYSTTANGRQEYALRRVKYAQTGDKSSMDICFNGHK
jgi:hypothetical protein